MKRVETLLENISEELDYFDEDNFFDNQIDKTDLKLIDLKLKYAIAKSLQSIALILEDINNFGI